MKVSLNVELTKKEERTSCTDESRSTKKVKIRDNGNGTDDSMEESNDREGSQSRGCDQQMLEDKLPSLPDESESSDNPTIAVPMPEDASPNHLPHQTVSFKDKLMGQILSSTTNADSNADNMPTELTIGEGDVEVCLEGLIPAITFSGRIKELMAHCMKHAVIVKLLGRFIRQDILHARISSLWKPSGGFKLTELEGGCYMVKLENAADYQNALLGGPWVVLGHYLTVHPWEPSLSPNNLEIKQVYGWVRLPGLPYHYYHKSILRAIGEVIGQVLKIDYNTEGFAKARFARLAVKLDLTKPLVSRIKLDGITQFVEYEGLPTICYACGRYGHLEEACPHRIQQSLRSEAPASSRSDCYQSKAATKNTGGDNQACEDRIFGEWMKAKPRNGRLARVAKKDGQEFFYPSEREGSRFNPLASLDNDENHKEENPSAEIVQRSHHASPHTKPNSRNPRLKSTPALVFPSASPALAPTPKVPVPSDKPSIFESSVYKEDYLPTSLGPTHTAVVLAAPSRNGERPFEDIGPRYQRPNSSSRAGRNGLNPKPPDGPKHYKGLHLNLKPKFKTSKLKTMDTLGLPSEELSKAISDALGRPNELDDDMVSEATELGFESDAASV